MIEIYTALGKTNEANQICYEEAMKGKEAFQLQHLYNFLVEEKYEEAERFLKPIAYKNIETFALPYAAICRYLGKYKEAIKYFEFALDAGDDSLKKEIKDIKAQLASEISSKKNLRKKTNR